MLNKNEAAKDRENGVPCFGEDASLFSQSHSSHDGAGESNFLKIGELLLDGEEVEGEEEIKPNKIPELLLDGEEGEGEEEIKPSKIPQPASLSIPDTVFLPSEVKSVVAVSGLTHENEINVLKEESKRIIDSDLGERNKLPSSATPPPQSAGTHENEKNVVKESKEGKRIVDSALGKRNQLPSSATAPRRSAGIFCRLGRLRSCISRRVAAFGDCSFNTVQLFPVLVSFAALLLFTSWRSHSWKNEALRASEELRKQRTILPLTLSLLKERRSLVEKQKLLEQELINLSGGDEQDKYNFEGVFSDEESDDTLLSIKNCYVEASLSLGRCSKEWQKWWSDADDGSPSDATDDESTEHYSYDSDFTDDMAKLVNWGYGRLASTTTKSISFIEKKLKSTDDYIQSIVQSAPFPKMASNNDTGGG